MEFQSIQAGDIISHNEMCHAEGYSLQRGMNFKVNGKSSVILMSLRKGAPYDDEIREDGQILIYEGHDVPKNEALYPKLVDQQMTTFKGTLTQNGKFYNAAQDFKSNSKSPELIKVYEKIKDGIWVYNGVFELIDAWVENTGKRNVFKFKLKISDIPLEPESTEVVKLKDLAHTRMIPTTVKLEVWKRDKGICTECGSNDNLHFDHILPYAKGGTSLKADNIQLLCARHNLQKSDKII